MESLKDIFTMMVNHGITDLELEKTPWGKLKIQRPPGKISFDEKAAEQKEVSPYKEILSPLVGVFHKELSKEESILCVGSKIEEGSVIGWIEAMKLMNPITSPYPGIIREICVKDGQVLDYNQVILKIEEISCDS